MKFKNISNSLVARVCLTRYIFVINKKAERYASASAIFQDLIR